MELILASQSSRRREIMDLMGLSYQTDVCTENEEIPSGLDVPETVMHLAYQKASFVLRRHPNDCVIGADTVIDLDGEIIGKPRSPGDAVRTLQRMQGRSHTVYTGIAVLKQDYSDVRYVASVVRFRPMSNKEINWYVSTGEPMDKAGSYGIQGLASVFVESIEGNYFNIVGLPAPVLYDMLLKAKAISEDRR